MVAAKKAARKKLPAKKKPRKEGRMKRVAEEKQSEKQHLWPLPVCLFVPDSPVNPQSPYRCETCNPEYIKGKCPLYLVGVKGILKVEECLLIGTMISKVGCAINSNFVSERRKIQNLLIRIQSNLATIRADKEDTNYLTLVKDVEAMIKVL